MQHRRLTARARLWAVLVVLMSALAMSLGPAHADPTRPPGCGWTPLGNVLYPDLDARYWHVQVPVQPGGQVRVSGQFPHARYLAFALQGPGGSGDAIHDTRLIPDSGSTNPFVAGADRDAAQRNYTLHVVATPPPARRAPNTLYAGSGTAGRSIDVMYRIYDVDADVEQATAGVGFPAIESLDAAGKVTAACHGGKGSVTPGVSFVGRPVIASDGIGALGTDPPAWQKFVNTQTVYAQLLHSRLLGDAAYNRFSAATSRGSDGGLGANVDNQYISTLLNPHYGKVLVLQATMPTFPQTYQGQTTMGSGQVRYWSMCSEIFTTTAAVSCLPDHAIPLGPQRTFTLVVSAPRDRPANATVACGVAWLPMGSNPGTALMMRNLLADPGFAQGIGNAELNREATTMGAYYPRGQYLRDAAAFEERGCRQ